jgi:hypothetical protein
MYQDVSAGSFKGISFLAITGAVFIARTRKIPYQSKQNEKHQIDIAKPREYVEE